MKYAIGVDLGGNKILAGIVNKTGKIITKVKYLTYAEHGYEFVINRIVKSIKSVIGKSGKRLSDIVGVGIGAPGPLDPKSGVIHSAPNLPGWKEIPLKDEIQQKLINYNINLPVFVDNDANLAALGEWWIRSGSGANIKNLIFVTLGTGVGSGLILDGKLYHGAEDSAGELGHITIFPDGRKCPCGNYGCLERYCSATGIVISMKEAMSSGEKTRLHGKITSKKIYQAALKGDKLSIKILKDAGKYLGIGLATVVNLLNLELIILGGNVADAWEFIYPEAKKEISKRALFPAKKVKLLKSKSGIYAGMLGAARLVFINTSD